MRIAVRIILLAVFLVALAVVLVSLVPSLRSPVTAAPDWSNPLAAALAVVAAAISAWGSQRLLEQEEDVRKPFVLVLLDVSSRHMVTQLVLRNAGQLPAYDVEIQWQNPPRRKDGSPVSFSDRPDGLVTPALDGGTSVASYVDITRNLLQRETLTYVGTVLYATSPGKKKTHQRFQVSLEPYRHTLTLPDDMSVALEALPRIPDELKKISFSLEQLRLDAMQTCSENQPPILGTTSSVDI